MDGRTKGWDPSHVCRFVPLVAKDADRCGAASVSVQFQSVKTATPNPIESETVPRCRFSSSNSKHSPPLGSYLIPVSPCVAVMAWMKENGHCHCQRVIAQHARCFLLAINIPGNRASDDAFVGNLGKKTELMSRDECTCYCSLRKHFPPLGLKSLYHMYVYVFFMVSSWIELDSGSCLYVCPLQGILTNMCPSCLCWIQRKPPAMSVVAL